MVDGNTEQDTIENRFITERVLNYQSQLRIGVYLIRTFTQNYRHSELSAIYETVSLMNSTVYNYFRDNYGYKNAVSEEEIALKKRYENVYRKDLKNKLETEKLNNASINNIKYVAKPIRSRINKNPINIAVTTDNYDKISKIFWGYAKIVFRYSTSILASFKAGQSTTYFTNVLKCIIQMKVFTILSWVPKLKEPNIPFNLSLPSHQKITRIIKRMKSSGSPCPLDQISIICFKRCPYLRSFMLNIWTEVIRSNNLPA